MTLRAHLPLNSCILIKKKAKEKKKGMKRIEQLLTNINAF